MHATNFAHAQWVKLKDFGKGVTTVYFIDLPAAPRIGFVGIVGSNDVGEVWRTNDGGKTWAQSSLNIPTQVIQQFTFEDSLVGWFASWLGSVYKTIDGGLTWNALSLPVSFYTAIEYHAPTKLLFVTGDNGQNDHVSADEGATWFDYVWGTPKGSSMTGYWGIHFNDASSGIVAATHDRDHYLYTTDGGLNWVESPMQAAGGVQPTGIAGTKIFLTPDIGPYPGCITRSDDGGKTWRQGAPLPTFDNLVLEGGLPMLAFQSEKNNGFYVSFDTGTTFTNICGPSAINATRFYVKDYTIYASDADARYTATHTSLWMNTVDPLHIAGKGPQLETDTLRLGTVPCGNTDDVLHYSMSANCQGFLTNISITGSPSIQTKNPPALPHVVSADDSLILRYTPTGSSYDTVILHLSFTNGTEQFDTSVVVIAQAIGSITSIGIFVPAGSGAPGDTISIKSGIVVSPIVDVTLPFSYTISFDASLLSPIPLSGTTQSGIRTMTIYDTLVHGRPHSSALRFIVGLGDKDSTFISATQLTVGSACSIHSTYGDGVFRLLNVCRSGGARLFDPSVSVSLSDPQPNPATTFAKIDLSLSEEGPTTLQLFDALGKLVGTPFSQTPTAGSLNVTLDLSRLPNGTYYYRLQTPSQIFTKKLIISR
jgi:hypothetical protein